jgi:hypothetical protein
MTPSTSRANTPSCAEGIIGRPAQFAAGDQLALGGVHRRLQARQRAGIARHADPRDPVAIGAHRQLREVVRRVERLQQAGIEHAFVRIARRGVGQRGGDGIGASRRGGQQLHHQDAVRAARFVHGIDRGQHRDRVPRDDAHQQHVVAVGQDRVDLGPMLAPQRPVVEGRVDDRPIEHVVVAAQPEEAVGRAAFEELAEHHRAELLEGFREVRVEPCGEARALPGRDGVAAQLDHVEIAQVAGGKGHGGRGGGLGHRGLGLRAGVDQAGEGGEGHAGQQESESLHGSHANPHTGQNRP